MGYRKLFHVQCEIRRASDAPKKLLCPRCRAVCYATSGVHHSKITSYHSQHEPTKLWGKTSDHLHSRLHSPVFSDSLFVVMMCEGTLGGQGHQDIHETRYHARAIRACSPDSRYSPLSRSWKINRHKLLRLACIHCTCIATSTCCWFAQYARARRGRIRAQLPHIPHQA
jgi:hypothetical protein